MINAKNNRKRMRETRKTMVGASGEPLGAKASCLKEWTDGARYWVRTSDPLRVREVLYH